jgi:hypothetical protein
MDIMIIIIKPYYSLTCKSNFAFFNDLIFHVIDLFGWKLRQVLLSL